MNGLDEKVFSRLDKIELKKYGKRASQLQPEIVYRSLPLEVIREDKAVSYLKQETDLDEKTIQKSISKLIETGKVVTAFDSENRLYVRKNPFAK